MKTRTLAIIVAAIVIASVMSWSFYTIYDSSYDVFISCTPKHEQINDKCVLLKPEQYCTDWCDLEELSDLGCGGPVLDYIYRHTNLFDEKFDNTFYYRNAMGLPDGVSEKQFEVCEDIVHKKRILTDSGKINPEKDIPIFFEVMLMEQGIEWIMPQREWNNHTFEIEPPARICSEILYSNGTNAFLSTVFQTHYTLSNMTFHNSLPEDCVKVLPVTKYGRK
ncbi:MAG: hypothetical protein ACW9W4_01100 [Candidatus Nitrosopumilus sp. bin_7KS]